MDRKPIGIEIDARAKFAYVRYREGTAAKTVDVWLNGRVSAKIDAEDRILQIDVLGLDPTTLSHARHYATAHDLAFPTLKPR